MLEPIVMLMEDDSNDYVNICDEKINTADDNDNDIGSGDGNGGDDGNND